ncbi:MAG: high-affinity nickel-transport family protein [Verrucomicrobiota bacterium]|nr:high-affinity nickel-transport family protein [Verrucomicrobiota bacterium]
MITLFPILLFGFFLGTRHATDSDHVVAVTTIVSRQRSIWSAAWTGIFWGIGHSLTLLVIGGAIILFGIVVPERLGMSLEFGVALMLILLGALNLRATFRAVEEVTAGGEHDSRQQHPHRHGDLDRWFGRSDFYRALRPIAIGTMHGLAGSAAVALLVLPIIHEPLWAMAYLVIFGVGTIAGMMLITAAIAVPVSYSTRFQFLHRHLGAAAGALSLGFGIFLVYHIGYVQGLFR